ncbi:hypothetical protein BDV97DRAFT_4329, partial [Delphinella strobiligena]
MARAVYKPCPRIYHLPLNNVSQKAMARHSKHWMPDHQPTWTTPGVARSGDDDMKVEIE